MRFMMIVKANQSSEAGNLPGEELLAAMGRYNEELMKAGVLLELNGLHPSSDSLAMRWCIDTLAERSFTTAEAAARRDRAAGRIRSRPDAGAASSPRPRAKADRRGFDGYGK